MKLSIQFWMVKTPRRSNKTSVVVITLSLNLGQSIKYKVKAVTLIQIFHHPIEWWIVVSCGDNFLFLSFFLHFDSTNDKTHIREAEFWQCTLYNVRTPECFMHIHRFLCTTKLGIITSNRFSILSIHTELNEVITQSRIYSLSFM